MLEYEVFDFLSQRQTSIVSISKGNFSLCIQIVNLFKIVNLVILFKEILMNQINKNLTFEE